MAITSEGRGSYGPGCLRRQSPSILATHIPLLSLLHLEQGTWQRAEPRFRSSQCAQECGEQSLGQQKAIPSRLLSGDCRDNQPGCQDM